MLPKSANVVIIGGGVLGTSAAFHLAEAGHQDILLLDRGPIASGTTPFAAGQTGYLNKDGFSEPLKTLQHELDSQSTFNVVVACVWRSQRSIRPIWQNACRRVMI